MGGNKYGQLGTGDMHPRTRATWIQKGRDPDILRDKHLLNKSFIYVSCGYSHATAVTSKNKLYCWGKNKYGQLGLDDLYVWAFFLLPPTWLTSPSGRIA